MRVEKQFLLVLLCGLLAGCAGPARLMPAPDFVLTRGRSHPLVGRVWSRQQAKLVTPQVLMAEVEHTSILLLGETHDNPDHHRLQAMLLDRFLTLHPGAVVVFEMLDEGQKSGLTEPRPRTAAELAERVQWAEHGWPDFNLYRPVFESALRHNAQIAAGHPERERFLSAMHGEPGPDADSLHLTPEISGAARAALVEEIREAHCGHANEAMIEPMLRAQSFRDAWMARALSASRGPAALIAGRGHVQDDRAVPIFLARQGLTKYLTVALLDVSDEQTKPEDYDLSSFDFAVFTPRVSDESACDRFKQQLEAMRKKAE